MYVKTLLLTEIISPYRIPVFNAVARILGDKFRIIFFGETERRRNWKIYKNKIQFNYEVLPGILFQKKGASPYFLNPTLFLKLVKYSPEVIILGGYHHLSSLLTLIYAKLFRKGILLWCESNKYDLRSPGLWKESYKRWFIKECYGCIVPGRASYEYVLSLGARPGKIWRAPNAVDNDYFTSACDKYRETKEILKHSKGYPKKLILYVGRLVRQKGIQDLLMAFQSLTKEHHGLGLLLAGGGEDESRYQDFCRDNNLKDVFFTGFIQQEELPLYYAIADVFVLPTHSDPWGLVLNEAMASKLPVISSDVAGAARDLIIPGENGYIFRRGDIQQLTVYIKNILADEQKRDRMAQKSFEIIQNYSAANCARGFIQAIESMR